MTAPAIPNGAWPYWMDARHAAGFCCEKSVETFRRRIGSVYPEPIHVEGRGEVWRQTDLTAAMDRQMGGPPVDGADML